MNKCLVSKKLSVISQTDKIFYFLLSNSNYKKTPEVFLKVMDLQVQERIITSTES